MISIDDEAVIHEFYDWSAKIETESEFDKKLDACDHACSLIPEFIQYWQDTYGQLPVFVRCRDQVPWLYAFAGRWPEAIDTIQMCIDIHAFSNKRDGTDMLLALTDFHKTADLALQFIRLNPGCLQRNIHKALAPAKADKYYLSLFLKNSIQIRKEVYGTTYKLFAVD